VRQAASRTNLNTEISEIKTIGVGIALSRPISLNLRTSQGDTVFKIHPKGQSDWESHIFEGGLSAVLSPWNEFDFAHDDVTVSIKFCHSDNPKILTFYCTLRQQH
jgi:hypothetical protein